MPGNIYPEASFPSSHTMLICVVMSSAILLLDKYMNKDALCTLLRVTCAVIIVVTVIGRLISGVHWFTDILGGILISTTLLHLYAVILEKFSDK